MSDLLNFIELRDTTYILGSSYGDLPSKNPSQNIQYFCKKSGFFSNFLHKTFNIFSKMSRFFPFPSQNIQYFSFFLEIFSISFTKHSIFSLKRNLLFFFLHKMFNIFSSISPFLTKPFTKYEIFCLNVPAFPSQNLQYFSFLFWRKKET